MENKAFVMNILTVGGHNLLLSDVAFYSFSTLSLISKTYHAQGRPFSGRSYVSIYLINERISLI